MIRPAVAIKAPAAKGDRLKLHRPMTPLHIPMKGSVYILRDGLGLLWEIKCTGPKRSCIWEVMRPYSVRFPWERAA